jgi:hypothetical protein
MSTRIGSALARIWSDHHLPHTNQECYLEANPLSGIGCCTVACLYSFMKINCNWAHIWIHIPWLTKLQCSTYITQIHLWDCWYLTKTSCSLIAHTNFRKQILCTVTHPCSQRNVQHNDIVTCKPFLGTNSIQNTFPWRWISKTDSVQNSFLCQLTLNKGFCVNKPTNKHIPRLLPDYVRGCADKNTSIHSLSESSFVSCEWLVNQNQVSHSRRKTRREDSHSPVRMEWFLGSHWLWAVVIDCDCKWL